MIIMPLSAATDAIMRHALNGDRSAVETILDTVVRQRTQLLHERAQAAEGRAIKAERMSERFAHAIAEARP